MCSPPLTAHRKASIDSHISFYPRSPETRFVLSYFSAPLLSLTASLYFQTAIKWALTEGDKLLIATFASLEAQGMYALSANYGGFVARMVFKPIEESSRNLFANLCAAPPAAASSSSAPERSKSKSKSKTGAPPAIQDQRNQNVHSAALFLRTMLRAYNTLSLLVFTLGPTAAPLLLRLVAGPRWSDSGAGEVLGKLAHTCGHRWQQSQNTTTTRS